MASDQKGGTWLQRRWPVVLAGLLLFVGGVLTVLGGVGLVKDLAYSSFARVVLAALYCGRR